MNEVNAVCTACLRAEREKPFAVPYPIDPAGRAMMAQHIQEQHGLDLRFDRYIGRAE